MLRKSDEEKKKNIHLLDCVKLFTEEEQLGEDDPWCVMLTVVSHTDTYRHAHTHTRTRTCTHTCTFIYT